MVNKCIPEVCRQHATPAVGFKTHIGFGRQDNEDAAYVASSKFARNRGGLLMALADGIGGHKGGGYASHYTCEALDSYYERLSRRCGHLTTAELYHYLIDHIYRIDRRLRLKASTTERFKDMGTTLSCLVLTDTHSIIGHVGDSRIYRWRAGHLSCLTKDHTFVQEMIDEGEIDPATADRHPLRHLLTQVVGTAEPLEHVYARIDTIKAGDRFLVCTDGLHNAVSERKICNLLTTDGNAETLAAGLVNEALANETRDNVTVLVAMVGRIGGADNRYTRGCNNEP